MATPVEKRRGDRIRAPLPGTPPPDTGEPDDAEDQVEVSLDLRAKAELERRRRARAHRTRSTHVWYPTVSPEFTWTWGHTQRILDTLDKVTSGEITHLLVLMPPRHGKSETITIRYPIYRLDRDLGTRIIVAGYNSELAELFSRRSRRIAEDHGLPLDNEKKSASDWGTRQGGGIRAVGVGAGVTGRGGDVIIVDDPVKSREEAESPAYRERVWNWFTNDLYTRREPGCAVIVVLTHWHFDDLAGRIMTSEDAAKWTVLKLPALAEEDDPLGRAPGAALCPDRYTEEDLHTIRRMLGEYGFSALYQQRPVPRTGNMFPRDKVEIVDHTPGKVVCTVRAWDKAATLRGGAYTCGIRMHLHEDGTLTISDMRRGQWDSAFRDNVMVQTALLDGPSVYIELEQEPGSGGKDSSSHTIRLLQGYTVRALPASGDKATRAEPFAAQWQAGHVRLVRGEWNTAYLSEMEVAPLGRYVDQMDASSMAYNSLARRAQVWWTSRDFATIKY